MALTRKKNKILLISSFIIIILIISTFIGFNLINNRKNRDSDNDGIRDEDDDFPNDISASIDKDGDGYPDYWNKGKSEIHSTSGLELDLFPNNSSLHCIGDLGFDFIGIPSGSFEMGAIDYFFSIDEKTVHTVHITRNFEIMSKEVTFFQWEKIMLNYQLNITLHNKPVVNVSWYDCVNYTERLSALDPDYNYHLPTEAEWEYCCRAGSKTQYSFGDNISDLGDYGWFRKNSNNETHNVGSKTPNAWGLYDMHGNVMEWCSDWWNKFYYENGTVNDPQGPENGTWRVMRGGSWSAYAIGCKSAYRSNNVPDATRNGIGFRIVRI